MEALLTPENIMTLITLTGLEVVLGIDNVIFIAILVQNLPAAKRRQARAIGLSLAFILRIVLLFSASWLIGLTEPIFNVAGLDFAGRHLFLIAGGLFLILKSGKETWDMFGESHEEKQQTRKSPKHFAQVIASLVFVDFILSFDSVITAVGMTSHLSIIIIAIVIAMIAMLVSADPIGKFIYNNPSIKVLALSFITLVGVFLVGEGLHLEIPKGYIYFAMFFSLATESVNIMLARKRRKEQEEKA